MAKIARACLLVAFVACVLQVRCGKAEEMTIDAAYSFIPEAGGVPQVHILSGDRIYTFDGHNPTGIINKSEINFPADFDIQAAFSSSASNRFIYGADHAYAVSYKPPALRRLRYGPRRAFIRDGGPDAAGRKDGKVYMFKGCDVSIRTAWNRWSKPKAISDVVPGVPCNVDAALHAYGLMYIFKGAQLWRWEANGEVVGPTEVSSAFTFYNNWVD